MTAPDPDDPTTWITAHVRPSATNPTDPHRPAPRTCAGRADCTGRLWAGHVKCDECKRMDQT